jgi:hypothetical protein
MKNYTYENNLIGKKQPMKQLNKQIIKQTIKQTIK